VLEKEFYFLDKEDVLDYLYYLKFVAVLVAGILIGRWLDQERKQLRKRGEPWHKLWFTPPGILVIIILCTLIALRFYLRNYS